MDQPLRVVTDKTFVVFHKFYLEDADPANIEEPPSAHWLPEDNMTVRQGIVYMRSPGHTHSAIVTMQAWTNEPPREAENRWELIADLEVVLRSGTVVAVDGAKENRTTPLDLGAGPLVYHLRVNSRGHERMRQLEGGGGIPEEGEIYRPGEEYVFQFWPARPIPDDLAPPFHPKRAPRIPHGMRPSDE